MCNQTLEEGCLCCWAKHQLFQLHVPARGHLQFSQVLPVSQYQVAEAFGHLGHQTCCWGCREALAYLWGSKSHIVEVEEHIMNLIMKLCSASSLAKCCTVLSFSFAYCCKTSMSVLSSGSLKKQVISKDGLGVTEYAVTINFLAHSHLFWLGCYCLWVWR